MVSALRIAGSSSVDASGLNDAAQGWTTLVVSLSGKHPTPEQLSRATLASLGFNDADIRAYEQRYAINLVRSFAESFAQRGVNGSAFFTDASHPRGAARVDIPTQKLEFLRQFIAERRAPFNPISISSSARTTPAEQVAASYGADAAGRQRAILEARLEQQEQRETPSGARIKELLSYGLFDWTVTGGEERQILDILKNDTQLAATVRDLHRTGWLGALFERVDETSSRHDLVRLFGATNDAATRTLVAPHVNRLGQEWQVQYNLARLGVTDAAANFDRTPFNRLLSNDPTRAFTGVGASGTNPTQLGIPLADQFNLLRKDPDTVRRYSNPLDNLQQYLDSLTPGDRARQAELLLRQPISTTTPEAYNGRLPSRADVIRAAARQYNLEPELIAAFILAEQRDQTRNEDAKDYTAATSLAQANTSIGLGQVVVTTATGNDLFADLLSTETRGRLGHDDVAALLASDEVNIFAAARYIRQIADMGARADAARLPETLQTFSGLDLPSYSRNSSTWPEDNLRALGSEYTSAPWDDYLSPGWGNFVLEAYRDVKSSGVFRP